MKIKLLLCMLLGFTLNLCAQNNFVYTNDDATPNTVSVFKVNANGSLTLIPGSPFATGGNGEGDSDIDPGKITTASVGKHSFLYAGNTADGTVSGFSINPQTGSLVLVPGAPVVAGATNSNLSLTASPNGRFLFSTDEVSPVIHVFEIASATGELTEVSGSPFPSGANSEGLKVSPNGKFLVVGLKSIDSVGVFAIGEEGALTPVAGSPFPASGAATWVDVNCQSNRVFASNAGSNLVNAYHMAENGSLTPVAGSPFSSGGTSTINAFTLSPNNEFLFTSNAFNETISSLLVAPNGSLHPVPESPFGAADFVGGSATTRDGRFLYVSLFAIAEVDAWSISPTGQLVAVSGAPFSTGQSPLGEPSLTTFPAPACPAIE